MNQKTKLLIFCFSIFSLVLVACSVASPILGVVTITAPVSTTAITMAGVVNTIVRLVFGIAIVFAIVYLVIYGIKYMMAGDDSKKIEGAKKGITGAFIGLVAVILTFALVKGVAYFLGAGSTNLFEILPASLILTT